MNPRKLLMKDVWMQGLLLLVVLGTVNSQTSAYQDFSFYSNAFKTERWYRIYLPEGYEQNPDKRYPVIYYFHGYGGRYKWDGYDLEDDVNYPDNGRKEPPFVMEWGDYVQNHEVIIVTWDGYEPMYRPGKKFREGIQYGNARPYDYGAPYDKDLKLRGWDYREYFKDLVDDVDKNFRTISDRYHRAITGLSMGGQTAYYIAGQSKDLLSSVSAFDPADNFALYGPEGFRSVLPVLESYRALIGLDVRLTLTDGDWLKYNTWKMNHIFEASEISKYEFHLADYPNHFVADTKEQLDFHMNVFGKPEKIPDRWSHFCVGFPSFTVFGYDVSVKRSEPAITLLDHLSLHKLEISARTFIPDGPIVVDELVSVTTDERYNADETYTLNSLNLTTNKKETRQIVGSSTGQLSFDLTGGGHIVGIHELKYPKGDIFLFSKNNQEYFFFEIDKDYGLNLQGINVGNAVGNNIEIRAFSTYPYIQFEDDLAELESLEPLEDFDLSRHFAFHLSEDSDSTYMSYIDLEINIDGISTDTQRIMFFPVEISPTIEMQNVIILDGREVENVSIYQQGLNIVEQKSISGGAGNGNGIFEAGEDVLIYIKMGKGMGSNDIDTYHRTYLINSMDQPYVEVMELDYKEKTRQAGATSVASMISLSKDVPEQHEIDLWLKVESLYNDGDDPVSNAVIYAHKYNYVRLKMQVAK